ncbi:hypothetical protein Hanom_Chr04g00297201 [Helianthus anomalus]
MQKKKTFGQNSQSWPNLRDENGILLYYDKTKFKDSIPARFSEANFKQIALSSIA